MTHRTLTFIAELQIGDRFYRATDKKKVVFQKVEYKRRFTNYQIYSNFAISAIIIDGNRRREPMDKYIETFKSDTQVVFLRHTN